MPRRVCLLSLALLACGTHAIHADGLLPPDRPIEQVLDHYIDAQLREAKITPAPLATDTTLLRRLTLDLNSRIPTVAEMDAYLANSEPNKKVQLVDRLLASSAFVRHQAQEFAALLQTDDGSNRGARRGALQGYLLKSFAENRP